MSGAGAAARGEVCPKCGFEQPPGDACQACGLVFAKAWAAPVRPTSPPARPAPTPSPGLAWAFVVLAGACGIFSLWGAFNLHAFALAPEGARAERWLLVLVAGVGAIVLARRGRQAALGADRPDPYAVGRLGLVLGLVALPVFVIRMPVMLAVDAMRQEQARRRAGLAEAQMRQRVEWRKAEARRQQELILQARSREEDEQELTEVVGGAALLRTREVEEACAEANTGTRSVRCTFTGFQVASRGEEQLTCIVAYRCAIVTYREKGEVTWKVPLILHRDDGRWVAEDSAR